ncbi:MAG: DUF4360 domain-containing protein [Bdellovibrionales bacterium]|nr:DUF4360 domain-containing protein [Bdellovibrionales bacterium]
MARRQEGTSFVRRLGLQHQARWKEQTIEVMRSVIALLGLMAMISLSARAEVELGDVSLAGTGCPGGDNVYVYHSEYSGRLIVVFWEYAADQSLGNSKLVRKACAAAIPFKLAAGERLVLESPAIGGQFELDPSAELQAKLEVFLAGGTGAEAKGVLQTSDLAESDRFYFRNDTALVTSQCGQEGILRLNTSLLLKGGEGSSIASIRTAAVTLKTEACTPAN